MSIFMQMNWREQRRMPKRRRKFIRKYKVSPVIVFCLNKIEKGDIMSEAIEKGGKNNGK